MSKVHTAKGSMGNDMPAIKPSLSSKVAVGGGSLQSAAIAGVIVRLVATSDCHIAIGADPTAVADGTCVFLPASTPEYFVTDSGSKVAVIQDTAPGTLFVTMAL